jgi:hypothetical protein
MAFLDLRRTLITHQPPPCERPRAANIKASTWQRAALEFVGTFLALIGIALGILTLRFALVLMHGLLL